MSSPEVATAPAVTEPTVAPVAASEPTPAAEVEASPAPAEEVAGTPAAAAEQTTAQVAEAAAPTVGRFFVPHHLSTYSRGESFDHALST
ncbi:hypothetical protein PGTUg99_018089 [Puccinia graminis f. sp. tritici]|uniref:Uncharacterized protein n=1 Tax=Puccinia graminis f. sp. tritici TaxID=56615 RepID=A0A5B0S6V3_PUCGR|nr:hypothetical protein PGTUg99_018089 [Puccinia graminis f. sp. tritici]